MIKCKFIRCNNINDLNNELLIFRIYYSIISVHYISSFPYVTVFVTYKEKGVD